MPVLLDLRKAADERVDLSLFDAEHDNLTTVYAARLQSKRETFHATLAGRRQPTFATSGGRACPARLPDEAVMDILERSVMTPLTPKNTVTVTGVRAKVEEARRAGYAVALEEALLGEVALGAAVVDRHGVPLGAIHIAASLSEWTEEDFRRRFAPLAMEAAAALSG